jgi:hypothetical protein
MMCEFYQRHELGELDPEPFQAHLRECAHCQQLVKQDEKLLTLAKSLNQPLRSPLLWGKIENQIRGTESQSKRKIMLAGQWSPLWRLAAVVLISLGVGLGGYFYFKTDDIESQNILAANALKRVESVEQEYVNAIAELETVASTQMAQMDIELALLYRDRLATIDAQIQRCREALAENPGNAHIRRYLLAALQDKKQTLSEVTEMQNAVL